MKQPKSILTIKQKCKECDGESEYSSVNEDNCTCKGTGQQEMEIYDLKDFEKCYTTLNHHNLCVCKGTSYKIPFKDYEIKTIKNL